MATRTPLAAALALAAAALGPACRGGSPPAPPLRLGYFPNVTHAQALVGLDDGTFARAVPGGVDARMYVAGPTEMEALLAGDLDVAYVGPVPALLTYLREEGAGLRVVAGAASGGAALVVRPEVKSPEDLRGRRVASPQLGNTQDLALRTWLRARGLAEGAGAVEVRPTRNADVLARFVRGDLAGAWLPEPWAARLVAEARARVLVDERTLWPGGRYPTAVVVASTRALEARGADVEAFLAAHLALTRRWRADPAAFAEATNRAYGRGVGTALSPAVLREAFSRLEPLEAPLPEHLAALAAQAQALGFAPEGDLAGLVDPVWLERARGAAAGR